eukprot:jgi/Botrbrau1/3217/Bobra.37_2s0046.1
MAMYCRNHGELGQWLGSNLVPGEEGGLVWTFDVEGARGMLESYRATDLWQLLRSPPLGTAIHIVRALNSERWTPQEVHRLQEAVQEAKLGGEAGECGALHVHALPDAGHWLHADNPQGLTNLILPFSSAALNVLFTL